MMKKVFVLILLFAVALASSTTFISCKKKETDKTIFGTIYYKDSTSIPVANTTFSIHVTYNYGYPSKESNTSYTFSSDANGSFTAKYKSPKQASIHITYSDQSANNGNYIWSGASSKIGDDYNVGKVYAQRR